MTTHAKACSSCVPDRAEGRGSCAAVAPLRPTACPRRPAAACRALRASVGDLAPNTSSLVVWQIAVSLQVRTQRRTKTSCAACLRSSRMASVPMLALHAMSMIPCCCALAASSIVCMLCAAARSVIRVKLFGSLCRAQGIFSAINATFVSRNPLNDPSLSTITSLHIYEMTHLVWITGG
jgi:hypothetical protein